MPTPHAVRDWFDQTYAQKGLGYLRPPAYYTGLLALLDVQPGHALLDVGCGPGLLLAEAERLGAACHGIDVSPEALSMVPDQAPSARVTLGQAEALEYPDHSFDWVTCIGVLEHFLDVDRALEQMRRVTRPGGRLLVLVPNAWAARRWLGRERTFSGRAEERVATLGGWRRLFTERGLPVDRVVADDWEDPGPPSLLGRLRRRLPLPLASQFLFVLRVGAESPPG